MKRDWDVVRAILIALEDLGNLQSHLGPNEVPGCDVDNVAYHMRMLKEAGLIDAEILEMHNGYISCTAFRLTWEGHQFLDNMRDRDMWNRVKRIIREKGLELSFVAITTAGEIAIKKMLIGNGS